MRQSSLCRVASKLSASYIKRVFPQDAGVRNES
jgi:hypothetical protein